ncbi:hypothetical protein CDAR_435731 [Caerostris darwini]|uniref:ARMET N-terminal domain-containing protein n=1 Tax=Caerostris darwini TaxID=1538125 RepID=A0AAV4P9F3_9ARAC|nr:hypothetical protein CDAR_435731 [Caerostris darwini]
MLTNDDILLPKGPVEKFKEFCTLTEAEERRFCHYVGALEDSEPDRTFVVTSNIRREVPLKKRTEVPFSKKEQRNMPIEIPPKDKKASLNGSSLN